MNDTGGQNENQRSEDVSSYKPAADVLLHRLTYAAVFLLLLIGFFLVVRPFIVPFIWAAVVVVVTWPLYRRLHRRYPRAAPYLMSLAFAIVLLLAIVPLSIRLTGEATELVRSLESRDLDGLIERLTALPYIGPFFQNGPAASKKALIEASTAFQPRLLQALGAAAQGLLNLALGLVVVIFSSFFLYKNGRVLGEQLRRAAMRLGGGTSLDIIETTTSIVKGTVYGAIVTAIFQGVLAGLGFYIFGAPLPVLLGFATMVLSLIPFGPPFLYIPVAVYLVMNNSTYAGVGLAVYGTMIVSTADNVLRPLLISQSTSISLLLVFIAVIGGLISFGLLGVIAGPVIVAIAQTLWLTYTKEQPS